MKRVIESKKVKKDLYTKLYSDLHYIPGDNLSFLKKSKPVSTKKEISYKIVIDRGDIRKEFE